MQGLDSCCKGLGFYSESNREPPKGLEKRNNVICFAFSQDHCDSNAKKMLWGMGQ